MTQKSALLRKYDEEIEGVRKAKFELGDFVLFMFNVLSKCLPVVCIHVFVACVGVCTVAHLLNHLLHLHILLH